MVAAFHPNTSSIIHSTKNQHVTFPLRNKFRQTILFPEINKSKFTSNKLQSFILFFIFIVNPYYFNSYPGTINMREKLWKQEKYSCFILLKECLSSLFYQIKISKNGKKRNKYTGMMPVEDS